MANTVEWIDRRDRLPTKQDEDSTGAILVYNVFVGIHVSNAANYTLYGGLYETHWAHMPEKPNISPEYKQEVKNRL